MTETTSRLDVIVVGAGPIGLECAVRLRQAGLEVLVVDKGAVGQTVTWFPRQMHFFSSNDRIGIADVPIQTLDQQKATREEYLAYLRQVVSIHRIPVRTFEPVTGIDRDRRRLRDHDRAGRRRARVPGRPAWCSRSATWTRRAVSASRARTCPTCRTTSTSRTATSAASCSSSAARTRRWRRRCAATTPGRGSAQLPSRGVRAELGEVLAAAGAGGAAAAGQIAGHLGTVPVAIAPDSVALEPTGGGDALHGAGGRRAPAHRLRGRHHAPARGGRRPRRSRERAGLRSRHHGDRRARPLRGRHGDRRHPAASWSSSRTATCTPSASPPTWPTIPAPAPARPLPSSPKPEPLAAGDRRPAPHQPALLEPARPQLHVVALPRQVRGRRGEPRRVPHAAMARVSRAARFQASTKAKTGSPGTMRWMKALGRRVWKSSGSKPRRRLAPRTRASSCQGPARRPRRRRRPPAHQAGAPDPAQGTAGALDQQAARHELLAEPVPGRGHRRLVVLAQHVEGADHAHALIGAQRQVEAARRNSVTGSAWGRARCTRSGSISTPRTGRPGARSRRRAAHSRVVWGSAP